MAPTLLPTLLVEEMDMSQNQPPMPPQGYYQQQPPQPPKKKHTARNVVGIVVAVIVLIMVVRCSAGGSGSSGGSTAEASAGSSAASTASTAAGRASGTGGDGGKTVTMTASATGAGTVIWGTAGSTSTEQFTGAWTKEVQAEAADTYTLSVTGDAIYGDDSQEMGCTISVDGEQKQANSATGKMGSASCTVIVGLS